MLQPMWVPLTKVAISPSLRPALGSATATAIALLLSYRKHEVRNLKILIGHCLSTANLIGHCLSTTNLIDHCFSATNLI